MREYDLAARWGGEEFIMMLPYTGIKDATVVAERIRNRIENYTFRHQDVSIKATMTFGVCLINDDMSLDECIKGADQALYSGKESGRNKVVVA